jgi:glycosyltransferase involved in cell wall biosynthesis
MLSYKFWPPDFGGHLLMTIERAKFLSKRGFEITFLTSGRYGFPPNETLDGITIFRSPFIHNSRIGRLIGRGVFFVWSLRKILNAEFDALRIISLPGIGTKSDSIIGILLSHLAHYKKAKCVTAYSLADSEDNFVILDGFSGKLKKLYLHKMDKIVAISPALYLPLKEVFHSKAIFIPNGVRDYVFKPVKPVIKFQTKEAFGVPIESTIFVFLGSIGLRKGFDLIAKAFKELSFKYTNWLLWVIGPKDKNQNRNINQDEVDFVTEPIKDNKQVTFFGRIDNQEKLARVLGAGDIFIFPSRREGLPNAPNEAMAAGLPVIIARIPGVTDMVNIHGETGYYITPDNLDELKKAMEKLGTDKVLREKMGRKARARVIESFSWEKHIDQWEALYRSLIE